MPKPIKSPLQVQAGSPLFLVKLGADLLKVHETLLKKVDAFNAGVSELKKEADRIHNLPKGDRGPQGIQGPQGKPGYTPIKGKDYFDGKDAVMPDITVIAELAASLIVAPQNGKDAPALETIVEAVISELNDDNNELGKKFKKMDNEIASYRNQLAMGQHQPQAGKKYGVTTWARGGGGGSTSSGQLVTTQYQLTAVQAVDNVTIDLTQLVNWATFVELLVVYRNNIPQTETINFSLSGSTLTILQADASEVFNVTYSYT